MIHVRMPAYICGATAYVEALKWADGIELAAEMKGNQLLLVKPVIAFEWLNPVELPNARVTWQMNPKILDEFATKGKLEVRRRTVEPVLSSADFEKARSITPVFTAAFFGSKVTLAEATFVLYDHWVEIETKPIIEFIMIEIGSLRIVLEENGLRTWLASDRGTSDIEQ